MVKQIFTPVTYQNKTIVHLHNQTLKANNINGVEVWWCALYDEFETPVSI